MSGGGPELKRPVLCLTVTLGDELLCRIGNVGRDGPVPAIDFFLTGEAADREPRCRAPACLDYTERTFDGLSALVSNERRPGEVRAVARPVHRLQERGRRGEAQVA